MLPVQASGVSAEREERLAADRSLCYQYRRRREHSGTSSRALCTATVAKQSFSILGGYEASGFKMIRG